MLLFDRTILDVALVSTDQVECVFRKHGRGATFWQHFVDALEAVAEHAAYRLGEPIEYPDHPGRTLGRRGRARFSSALFYEVLRDLRRHESVKRGLEKGEFQILGGKGVKARLREERDARKARRTA